MKLLRGKQKDLICFAENQPIWKEQVRFLEKCHQSWDGTDLSIHEFHYSVPLVT